MQHVLYKELVKCVSTERKVCASRGGGWGVGGGGGGRGGGEQVLAVCTLDKKRGF